MTEDPKKQEHMQEELTHNSRLASLGLFQHMNMFLGSCFVSVHLCSEQVDWGEVVVFMVHVYGQVRAAVLGPYLLLLLHLPHLLLLKHTQEWHR